MLKFTSNKTQQIKEILRKRIVTVYTNPHATPGYWVRLERGSAALGVCPLSFANPGRG